MKTSMMTFILYLWGLRIWTKLFLRGGLSSVLTQHLMTTLSISCGQVFGGHKWNWWQLLHCSRFLFTAAIPILVEPIPLGSYQTDSHPCQSKSSRDSGRRPCCKHVHTTSLRTHILGTHTLQLHCFTNGWLCTSFPVLSGTKHFNVERGSNVDTALPYSQVFNIAFMVCTNFYASSPNWQARHHSTL